MQRELVDNGEVLAHAAILAGWLDEVEVAEPKTPAQLLRGVQHGRQRPSAKHDPARPRRRVVCAPTRRLQSYE